MSHHAQAPLAVTTNTRFRLRAAALHAVSLTSRALTGPCRSAVGWRVPILSYHLVAESGGADGYPWRVSPRTFEAQMGWLAEEGYRVVSVATLLDAWRQRRVIPRSVVLTFDDGHRGVLLHAVPVLRRYGFPATLFPATRYIGTPTFPWVATYFGGQELQDPEEFRPLSWEEIRALPADLVSLGSHTVTHPHLGRLSRQEMEWELRESRQHIESETGRPAAFFAYPEGIAAYGDHSVETRQAVMEAGYECAMVSELGRNGPTTDVYRLRRLGIGVEDSMSTFQAKVVGAYTWVRGLQWMAHRVLADPSD